MEGLGLIGGPATPSRKTATGGARHRSASSSGARVRSKPSRLSGRSGFAKSVESAIPVIGNDAVVRDVDAPAVLLADDVVAPHLLVLLSVGQQRGVAVSDLADAKACKGRRTKVAALARVVVLERVTDPAHRRDDCDLPKPTAITKSPHAQQRRRTNA